MKNNRALFFTGIGIGIFMGLSKSEILLQILVPLLTIIVGLLAILTGQKNYEKSDENETQIEKLKNINIYPVMWMILGMVAGSALGIPARTHQIFTPKHLKQKNFEQGDVSTYETVLFNLTEELCEELSLCDLEGWDLICQVKNVDDIDVVNMLEKPVINIDLITSKIHKKCSCQN